MKQAKTLEGKIDELAKDMSLVLRAVNNGFTNMEARFETVTNDIKIVKRDVKDVQGRVGNIEVALRQDQNRIGVAERKLGIER